jgi:peptidoglycan/xylan/chitin deacetylase (PgdA/CDA1 family)
MTRTTQFLYAKPILDEYGFKATCGWIGKTSERQTWQDVATLHQDGMDIESHTMTHAHPANCIMNWVSQNNALQLMATRRLSLDTLDNKTVVM